MIKKNNKSKMNEDPFEKVFGKLPEEGFIFNAVEISSGNRCIHIQYLAQGIGFGGVDIIIKDKKIIIDAEDMDKPFCDALIDAAIKKLEEDEKNYKRDQSNSYGYDNPKIFSGFLKSLYDNVTWE